MSYVFNPDNYYTCTCSNHFKIKINLVINSTFLASKSAQFGYNYLD